MDAPILDFQPDRLWIESHQGSEMRTAFATLAHHPALPLLLRREVYNLGVTTGQHRHLDFIALYAVREGRGFHLIDGHRYALSRGDIYLMAPGAAHSYCDYQALQIDAVYFQPTLFSGEEVAVLRQMPEFWRLFAGDEDDVTRRHRWHLTPEKWRHCESQIEELRREWKQDTLAARLLLRAGVFRLLVHLARWQQMVKKSAPLSENPFQRLASRDDFDSSQITPSGNLAGEAIGAEAVRYCEEHFTEPLTVPLLAARFFLSSSHLRELFAREAGMPPAAYIRHLRLEKAATLLRETALPVAHIAHHVGFNDAGHFNRAFRHAYGFSPLQFRKRSSGIDNI